MFEKSSIFVLTTSCDENKILRIEVEEPTQNAICKSFSEASIKMFEGKERVVFDGNYKPEDDEFFAIENFQMAESIKEAVRNPLGVLAYRRQEGEYPEIRAVFVGEQNEGDADNYTIAFQRFRREQYISTKFFNLFFDNNTFFRQDKFGISIYDSVDCLYTNGELQFESFYFSRQIFDLSGYYRSATDVEVKSFAGHQKLEIEDRDAFELMADTRIRRKIAMINDSKVLDNFSSREIVKRAKAAGVSIEARDNKIVIPSEKNQVKLILGFLDEEAYRGPFSQSTFLANSKRKIT